MTKKVYCKVCGKKFSKKRNKLGYNTCKKHGELINTYTIAPAYNKGAYQLIHRNDIINIGKS